MEGASERARERARRCPPLERLPDTTHLTSSTLAIDPTPYKQTSDVQRTCNKSSRTAYPLIPKSQTQDTESPKP
jgi:hypothetical protein